ncbi:hypothetical protein SISSUDRAFT_914691 [Sistotremastrum suecicum HHB10207 ss-3]|uniref:Uncharacterized protein n=1 Tax=Sistotremastrum suecicum HHB10207 ss-3 TaxID=1314776 RepID=A0A166BZ64_9AGAM|nr:hypothetical protein SISSUDRAFT_914691 [Sistotremastrum suecicum HHB10207 ss-3]
MAMHASSARCVPNISPRPRSSREQLLHILPNAKPSSDIPAEYSRRSNQAFDSPIVSRRWKLCWKVDAKDYIRTQHQSHFPHLPPIYLYLPPSCFGSSVYHPIRTYIADIRVHALLQLGLFASDLILGLLLQRCGIHFFDDSLPMPVPFGCRPS